MFLPLLQVWSCIWWATRTEHFYLLEIQLHAVKLLYKSRSNCSKCFGQGIGFQAVVLLSTKIQVNTQSFTIFCHNERTHTENISVSLFLLIDILELGFFTLMKYMMLHQR